MRVRCLKCFESITVVREEEGRRRGAGGGEQEEGKRWPKGPFAI